MKLLISILLQMNAFIKMKYLEKFYVFFFSVRELWVEYDTTLCRLENLTSES